MVSYIKSVAMFTNNGSLNPYCSGRWSRTNAAKTVSAEVTEVLILIVVEDGLVLLLVSHLEDNMVVLILIVVEDGLVLDLIRLF